MEQVCRVLNHHTASWLRMQRGTSERRRTQDTLDYRQTRNAAARRSRIKQRERRLRELLAL